MKKFIEPAVVELNISETANGFPSSIPEQYVDIIPGNDSQLPIWGNGNGLDQGGKGDQTTGDQIS